MVTGIGLELTVLDRIALLSLLPEKGDYMTLKIVRELREELSFTEDEHERLQFETREDGGLVWQDVGIVKEFCPGKKAREVIVDALRRADREKRLTPDHMHVYEMWMEPEDD